jgi:effector-binding domain-containing protein
MSYAIRLQFLPAQPLAVIRRRVAAQQLATVIPQACGQVWNVLRAKNVAGAGRHVALYWDAEINLEVGVELSTPIVSDGEVIASGTPAGRVATTIHFGPYNRLHEAHAAITRWCAAQGHALAGPSWEIYGHWTDECDRDASKIRTDVFYLLKPDPTAD